MQQRVWTFFLVMLAIVALWFTLTSLYNIYGYLRLNAATTATAVEWSVNKLSDNRFVLKGKYAYVVKENNYEGESLITYPAYRNRWAAESAIKERPKKTTVWYSSGNPAYAALQKDFPIKESVSALLLWGLLGYFYFLKNYIARVDNGKNNSSQ